MPYIKQGRRDVLRCYDRDCDDPQTEGELNYMLTKVVKSYLGVTPTYQDFNAAIGALEAAKLELYRRMVAPYEDIKIKENGDVY